MNDNNLDPEIIELFGLNVNFIRALTYDEFFSQLEKTYLQQSILTYYVDKKIKYGIKICHRHGRIFYNCTLSYAKLTEKLFFDNLRDAQNQCIRLIIEINKTK